MWETADVAEPAARRRRGTSDSAQALVERAHLTRLDVAQKLQGQMHRTRSNPTYVGIAGP